MFTDHWCKDCGENIASNLYKTNEERWANDAWKEHWRQLVAQRVAEHTCKSTRKQALVG